MMMRLFVDKNSIVRQIWGKSDTVLFIFAGAAAEFALNKAVDWLYFTGRLPADPLARLFSTMAYARRIIFSDEQSAHQAIDQITAIHKGVEKSRGAQIPDWAYRDVLFMLIDYSIRSYELLDRKLTPAEKQEVFDVFYRMGIRMELTGLPVNYIAWETIRNEHLHDNLLHSNFTADLYRQYRKHLGFLRYHILIQTQMLLVPLIVNRYLSLGKANWIIPVIYIYRLSRNINIDALLRNALLPLKYKAQLQQLDMV
jgi:hypothetical protein